jgi:hypothetical protein
MPSLDAIGVCSSSRSHCRDIASTVEISGPAAVNAETVKPVSKARIIIRLIELRVWARRQRQSIIRLIV